MANNNIVFQDFSVKVKGAIDDRINIALEEATAVIESAAARNTRVDTGKTKGSWKHFVNKTTHTGYVGNTTENSIYEEFGTGDYALNGNGRKGGWFYVDDKGKGHFTHGKKPSRALHNAFITKKAAVIKRIQDVFKGLK